MIQIVQRTGVILWILVAMPISALEQDAKEQRVIAVIGRIGGTVTRDEKAPNKPVVAVDLACRVFTDEDLADLKNLPSLRRLNLSFTRVTDKGIERLKGCTCLDALVLSCCPEVTDKGTEHLKALKGLRHLDLSHTHVTDTGLEQLHSLVGLRHLGLRGVHIGKEEEERLRRALPKMKIEQGNGNTAQKRVRKHFAIPDAKPLTTGTIRVAIFAKLPVGSTEKEVSSFLKKSGIGEDKFSSHYPADKDGVVVCRIEFDPASGEIVHTHYGILFRLNSRRRLKDVEVKEWYTGP